ncbi:hypothetical protein MBLNU457_7659t1 [Dothideomycetes sp. NU457]
MPPKPKTTKPKSKAAAKEVTPEQAITPDPSTMGSPGTEPAAETTDSVNETPKTKKRKRNPKSSEKTVDAKLSTLASDVGDAAPVTIFHAGDKAVSAIDTSGQFTFDLRLTGLQTFQVLTSIILPEEHQYAGAQAVIIKPSKAFPLMKLEAKTRALIWQHVLAPSSSNKIEISTSNNGISAKAYNNGLKPRLGPLMVNKTILAETRPILYSMNFRFSDTATLLNFLTGVSDVVRQSLNGMIEVQIYKKGSAAGMFNLLMNCTNLSRLHFATNIGMNSTPVKAANAFHKEAGRFLDAMAVAKGSKEKGFAVLSFGKSNKAFSVKEGEEHRAWTAEEKAEFQELLKGKMK